MKEEMFTSYVEFENEDGDTITLQVLDYFEYEGDLYGILTNACEDDDIEDDEEIEVCVLKVIEGEDGEEFVEPDEAKFPELQSIVEKILSEDCECDDDCCCDDGCDCHHHD